MVYIILLCTYAKLPMPHHQLFQTEWNSTMQIKYRFLKKYVARCLYNFFLYLLYAFQLFQNGYFRFRTLKFKCNVLEVSLVSLEVS